jgi:HK97 family phage major capsid protein
LPFNVRAPRGTAGASVGWTGQGVPALLSPLGFESVLFRVSKITGIVVTTKELARFSDPASEKLIRADLAAATAQFTDQQFLDPAIGEVPDISPASITNGAPEVESTGSTLAAATADLQNLLGQITTNFTAIYLVMKRSTALWLCQLKSGSGSDAFPRLGINGGDIWGIPVIVSDNTPSDTDSPSNKMIVAIDAAEIFLGDDGIELDASEEALLEMSTSPDSPRTAATALVSLWQNDLVATLVRRYVRWQRRREGSVAILTGVPF